MSKRQNPTDELPVSDNRGSESADASVAPGNAGDVAAENQRAAHEIAVNESYLRAILTSLYEDILVIDRDCRITDINGMEMVTTGYPRDEVIGRSCFDVFHGRETACDEGGEDCGLSRVFESGEPYSSQHTHVCADGSRVYVHVLLSPLRDEDGNITNVIAAVRDITQQSVRDAEMRQSEKMRAVRQLAGGAAHDFNNQLAGILGYADMLTRQLDDPKLQRYVDMIIAASARAEELTDQLLAFSTEGRSRTVAVNMHDVIDDVIGVVSERFGDSVKIERVFEADRAVVGGDVSRLRNALLHLAQNARDAMPDGGEIVFRTAVVALPAGWYAELGYELDGGDYLEVSVTDTGSGIGEHTLKHIFEPFFTTKGDGKGLGMGLSAVHGTVRCHGGAIQVDTELGFGATFRLLFPLSGPANTPVGDILPASLAVPEGARILVVDDETLVRSLAVDTLTELGCKAHTCKDGAEAVEYYRQFWENIDLVILDMIMPELGGRDTFLAMRKINPDVKVILASGYSVAGEAQAMLDEGAIAFVQKPYRLNQLAEHIARALAE